jgi:hypothetical protein
MTIDERLTRLTERHEALTGHVELLTSDLRQLTADVKELSSAVARQLQHEGRFDDRLHNAGRAGKEP